MDGRKCKLAIDMLTNVRVPDSPKFVCFFGDLALMPQAFAVTVHSVYAYRLVT